MERGNCCMNVGLIGLGYWGKILHSKLEKLSDVKFICTSKDIFEDKLDLVEWVFIATPDETHYDIVEKCISKGKNVFCEKPLTLNYKQSKRLFELADINNVNLYVDDVFNYRDEIKKLHTSINYESKIEVEWDTFSTKNYLNRLVYHDLYMLYPILNGKLSIKWPTINNISFKYGVSKNAKHQINDINFTHGNKNNDALMDMIYKLLNNNVNYDYNRKIILHTENILEKIRVYHND